MALADEFGGRGARGLVDDDRFVELVELLLDVYDSGGASAVLASEAHGLVARTSNDALAVLLDWWALTVGRASTGIVWSGLDVLPDHWVGPMGAVRDLADKLTAGVSAREWLVARAELSQVMQKLDYEIGYHEGNFALVGERTAWADLAAPYEALSSCIHEGGIPDEVPEFSESHFRRIAKTGEVKAGSDRDRFMKRIYGAMHELALQATALSVVANSVRGDVGVTAVDLGAANDPVTRVAKRCLRALNDNLDLSPEKVADRLEAAASSGTEAGIERLAFLTWQWHEANALAVPSIETFWAARRAVLDEVRRLRRSLPAEELDEVMELVESEPDLSEARELIAALREREDARGRSQSVLDRVHTLQRRVDELDPDDVDELRHRLSLIEADVADGRLADAEEGLDELGPLVSEALGEVRRARLEEIADTLDELGSGVVVSAGLLAQELRSAIAELGEGPVPEALIDEFEDRLEQVRAEGRRKVTAALDRVDARLDQAGASLSEDDRVRVQGLLNQGRGAVDRDDLLQADRLVAQGSALLDEKVVPVWQAIEGERELVAHLERYLQQSVHFSSADIRRLHVSLKAKRFVILAGLTGTGKSTIARLYAEALDATTENGRFRRVAVRPNWVDETEVLGYLSPVSNRFEAGWLAELIRTCHRDPDLPVFCVLDEMNLAPVEQYLADVLSAMEEQRTSTSAVPIQLYSPAADPVNRDEWPPTIFFPDNLFLVGTVNVDETTRPLSERVLDRANVLQLSTALDDDHHSTGRGSGGLEPRWRVRMGDWSAIVRDEPDDRHHEFLVEVAELLAAMRIGMGIRSHLEIERFCANAEGVLSDEKALDHALLQRVIPKIRGFKGDLGAQLEVLLDLLQGVGAESCARVLDDWLDSTLGDEAYLDGTAPAVGLAARG